MAGDIMSGIHTQPLQIAFYFIGYALAFAFIEKRSKESDFLIERNTVDKNAKDKINVSGILVETELEADNEENRFLRIVEHKNIINRNLFLLLYAVLAFFIIRANTESIHLLSLLPLVTAICIVFSATAGHLLIALFFNALYFIINSKDVNPLAILLYVLLFILTFVAYSLVYNENVKTAVLEKNVFIRNFISSIVPLVFILMTVNYFINKTPDIFNFKKVNQINHKAGAALERVNDISRDYMDKMPDLFKNTEMKFKGLAEKLPSLANNNANTQLPMSKLDVKNLPDINVKFSDKSLNSNSDGEKAIQETQNLVDKLDQSQSLSAEQMNQLITHLNKLKLEFPEDNSTNKKANTDVEISKLISEMQSEVKKMQNDPAQKEKSFASIKNSLKDISQSQRSSSGKVVKDSAAINTSGSEIAKLTPPQKSSPLINEAFLKNLIKIIKTLLFVAAFIGLLGFLNKFFKKTNYEELEHVTLEPEDELLLKNELKKLNTLKLSPKEEILLYYELVYKIIKLHHFPDTEAPPPTETYHQVVKKHLTIQKQLSNVTEIFCRSFYGSHLITKQELVSFRKSMPAILEKFGLKKRLF